MARYLTDEFAQHISRLHRIRRHRKIELAIAILAIVGLCFFIAHGAWAAMLRYVVPRGLYLPGKQVIRLDDARCVTGIETLREQDLYVIRVGRDLVVTCVMLRGQRV